MSATSTRSSTSPASRTISPQCFSPAFRLLKRLPSPARSSVMPRTRRCLPKWGRDVKGGSSISGALGKHSEIPNIMVAMTKIGEETGELGKILTMLAKFYNREVTNAVDTLVGLIEPIMIVPTRPRRRYASCRRASPHLQSRRRSIAPASGHPTGCFYPHPHFFSCAQGVQWNH